MTAKRDAVAVFDEWYAKAKANGSDPLCKHDMVVVRGCDDCDAEDRELDQRVQYAAVEMAFAFFDTCRWGFDLCGIRGLRDVVREITEGENGE